MSHSSLLCPQCGRPTIDGTCRRCTGREGVVLDETRQRLERSREQLAEWRERLRVKLDEADRRRAQLARPEARKAAYAPTAHLPDEPDEFAVAVVPTPAAHSDPPDDVFAPLPPEAAWPDVIAEADPHPDTAPAGGDPDDDSAFARTELDELLDDDVVAATMVVPEPPATPTLRGPGRAFDLDTPAVMTAVRSERFTLEAATPPRSHHSGAMVGPEATATTRADPRAAGARFDAATTGKQRESLSGSLVGGAAAVPRAPSLSDRSESHLRVVNVSVDEYPRPSLVLCAAANLLDVLLLLVLPAALLSLPATWLAFERDLGTLWTAHPVSCSAAFLSLFVFLETVFVGAVGRTPGLRLAGLQVVDQSGEIPSFGRAFARALLFPLLVVPALARLTGTAIVAE